MGGDVNSKNKMNHFIDSRIIRNLLVLKFTWTSIKTKIENSKNARCFTDGIRTRVAGLTMADVRVRQQLYGAAGWDQRACSQCACVVKFGASTKSVICRKLSRLEDLGGELIDMRSYTQTADFGDLRLPDRFES